MLDDDEQLKTKGSPNRERLRNRGNYLESSFNGLRWFAVLWKTIT